MDFDRIPDRDEAETKNMITEQNYKFLGISAVEDKLVEGIENFTETLNAMNIKMHILTGDSLNTALAICKNAKFFGENRSEDSMKILKIKGTDIFSRLQLSEIERDTADLRSINSHAGDAEHMDNAEIAQRQAKNLRHQIYKTREEQKIQLRQKLSSSMEIFEYLIVDSEVILFVIGPYLYLYTFIINDRLQMFFCNYMKNFQNSLDTLDAFVLLVRLQIRNQNSQLSTRNT